MEIIKMGFHSIRLRLLRIVFYSDLHAVRTVLSIAELIWAITLFMPGDTFGRPTYKLMSHFIASEEIWGAIFLFSALTQFYIVCSGHYHDRASVIFAGFNSILWWFVTISMYLSVSPVPAAISGELALCFAASWIYLRSGWIPNGARESNNADNN